MKKSIQSVFLVFVFLTVLLSGCAPAQTPSPAPAQPASLESASTPEPIHDIYAGFTDNQAMPFVMIDKSGESLVVTQDVNSSSITGVVWTSEDGQSIVVYADSDGKPQSAVIGNEVVLYSNYTNDTVDITIIHADGTREAFTSKLDTNFLNSLKSYVPPSDSLISYSPNSLQPQQFDKWFYMKTGLYMFGAATCAASVGAAITVGLAVPIIGIPLLAIGCSGTILGTAIRAGNILHMDVTDLENLNNGINGVKCLYGEKLLACANLIVNEAERTDKIASEILSKADYSGSQQATTPPILVVQSPTRADTMCVIFTFDYPNVIQNSQTGAMDTPAIFRDCTSGELFLASFDWSCPANERDYNTGGCKVAIMQPNNGCYQLYDLVLSPLNNNLQVVNSDNYKITVANEITSISYFTQCQQDSSSGTTSSGTTDTTQATQAQISNEIYFVALRKTPGFSNKINETDILASVPAGAIVQILGGPEQADGENWWNVSWNGITGWMADHTSSGKTIMIFLP